MTESRFPSPPSATPPGAPGLTRRLTARDVMHGLVGAVVGIVLVAAAGGFSPAGRAMLVVDPAALLALPAVWYVTVLVHELGHLLAGRAAGMRPHVLCIGPLRVDFRAGGPHVQRNRLIPASGGLALCLPAARTGRLAFLALIAGGPLASGMLAAAAYAIADAAHGAVAGVAMATVFVAGFMTLLNLVPMRVGGYVTDGGQIVALLRDDPAVRARLAALALVAQSTGGTRPRELDGSLLDALRGSGDAELDACAHALHAAAAEDRDDHATARAELVALAGLLGTLDPERIAPPTRRALALHVAAWLGLHARDAAGARAWLEYGRGATLFATALGVAEAAVALAEGRADDARAHAAAVRAALPAHPDRGSAIAIAASLDRLDAALAATSVTGL